MEDSTMKRSIVLTTAIGLAIGPGALALAGPSPIQTRYSQRPAKILAERQHEEQPAYALTGRENEGAPKVELEFRAPLRGPRQLHGSYVPVEID
jgi:hypothetical protein